MLMFRALFLVVAVALPSAALAATQELVVPAPTFHAAPNVRAAWASSTLNQRVQASTATPSKAWLAQQRERLLSMPAGTRIYNLSGFVIDSGSNSSSYDDESILSKTSGGYVVTRRGRVIGTHPLSSVVTLMPIAYWYEVQPGHVIPKKLRNRLPDLIAP